jgi:outer membrane receptor protein involved in Fe transport
MPRSFVPLCSGLLLASLASALPLAAQQPDSTRRDTAAVVLPPIEVVGSIRPFAGPAVGSNIPARITILSGKDLDAYRPRILSDVMQQQAGFSSFDDLGSPYKLNLSSRGFYASPVVGLPQGISVFLDGVRMNEVDASQVNFDLLPMEHIKRIELLSGNGSLQGRNSLGGAVNLVTSRGDGPLGGGLALSAGSFNSYRAEGSLTGLTRGGVDYYVGGMYNREGGWRDVTGGRQHNVFLNLGKLGEDSGIRFQALHARSRVETAGSLPVSVYRVNPDSNLTAGDYEDLWQLQVAVAGYKAFGAGRASFTTWFREHGADRFNANQASDPDAFGTASNRSLGYTMDYRMVELVGSGAVSLRFGIDGSINWSNISLFADSTKFGAGRILTTNVRAPIWDIAPFATADFTVGRMTFSAGVRVDHVEIPFHDLRNPSLDTTGRYTRINPRAGVSVDLGRGVSAFGSGGLSFRAPSVLENACADPETPCLLPFTLGDDPPLEPVKAGTVEAGFTYENPRASVRASAYHTNVRNDIFATPNPDAAHGSTLEGYFINLEKTRRQGVEASGRLLFTGGHSLYLNYAYTLATFQSRAEIFSPLVDEELGVGNQVHPGDRLPLVPEHQFKGGADILIGKHLSLGVDGRYVSPQYFRGDESNNYPRLDAYVIADARIGFGNTNWEITGIVTNLFNKSYAVFGTFNVDESGPLEGPVQFLTPGPRQAFRIVLRHLFGGGTHRGGIAPD